MPKQDLEGSMDVRKVDKGRTGKVGGTMSSLGTAQDGCPGNE